MLTLSYRWDDPHQRTIALLLEEEVWRKVNAALFRYPPKLPDPQPSLEQLQEAFALLEYQLARAYALRLLNRQEMSCFSLQQKLTDRLVSSTIQTDLLNRLIELDLINDTRWAEMIVRRYQREKRGPHALKHYLKRHQIDRQLIERLLQSYDAHTHATDFLRSHPPKSWSDLNEKRKLFGRLIRRGYDFDLIHQVWNEQTHGS